MIVTSETPVTLPHSTIQGDTSGCSQVSVDIKTKFRFSIKSLYKNATLIMMSTKPREQPDVSPYTVARVTSQPWKDIL